MSNIISRELENQGYQKKEKMGTIYYQKDIVILVYRDSGVWEFCADQGTVISDGIRVSTFDDIAYYTK